MPKEEMSNVRCWVFPSPSDASYKLCVQMVGERGEPLATVATIDVKDGMEKDLYNVFQGIRMAHRHPNE